MNIDCEKQKDQEAFGKWRGVHCFEACFTTTSITSQSSAASEGEQPQCPRPKAAISFTGGKDCHLALQRCLDANLTVVCGASFFPPGKKFNAHRLEWQRIQGEAMDIPLVDCPLMGLENSSPLDYAAAYAAAIRKLHEEYDVEILVTGDIDYVGNSNDNFLQKVVTKYDCHGVKVLLPLWQQSRNELLQEMLDNHQFHICFCCVKSPHFDASWIGRRLDQGAVREMEDKVPDGLDLTGENGEYHTMVINGPMYKTPLQFNDVTAHELIDQRGQKSGERWWVIADTANLEPSHC